MPIKSDPRDWTDPRHRRGLEGEEAAKRYLIALGWKVLAHRFRLGRCEIDIVARKGQLIAFVEVKTRWSRAFGSPFEAVTWAKQREITMSNWEKVSPTSMPLTARLSWSVLH